MSAGVMVRQPEKGTVEVVEQPGVMPMLNVNPMQASQSAGFVPMNTMTTPMIPAGLPPGLAYLAGLNEVRIHQQMELMEVIVGWERNNRYTICNNQEQQFMFAKEDTDCMTRNCLGPCRPFVMDITDLQGMQLIQLHRPFRCQGMWFWCCYLQVMEIHSPPGMPIGRVEEVWTCWIPKYRVFDNNDKCVFTILGQCCYCKLCVDVVFTVYEGDGEGEEVGQIRKHFGGARELCGRANDFSLIMPGQMDVMKKALLFGATFLIDFNYFEAAN